MTGRGSPIENWRRLERIAGQTTGEDGDWFRHALATFAECASDGMTAEQAFGLAGRIGHDAWHVELRRQERDEAIRAAARARNFGQDGIGVTAIAREIVADVRRLGRSAWDRSGREDKEQDRLLIAALRTGLRFPGERRVADILRSEI